MARAHAAAIACLLGGCDLLFQIDRLPSAPSVDASISDTLDSDGDPEIDATPSLTVDEVVAGGAHTCARRGGVVRCWGGAGVGQLGRASTDSIGDNELPRVGGDVMVGTAVARVAAGDDHTCAVTSLGKVVCWGNGAVGRLGYGNTNTIGDTETPASAGAVPIAEVVLDVVAGNAHTCVLRNDAQVMCWGSGTSGRLGYGNSTNIGDNEVPLGTVPFGGSASQVTAGGVHTCVLTTDKAVRCWGSGNNGRLGYANLADVGDNEPPSQAGDVRVAGVPAKVVAGGAHTCIVTEDQRVQCWGAGSEGRLGYGNVNDIGDNETPQSAGFVNVGGEVKDLAAGEAHTCALLVTGEVRCWGRNSYGQLGLGTVDIIGDTEAPSSVPAVDVGGAAVAITAGRDHTCARLASGAVRCWGRNGSGRLGYGNTVEIGDNEAPKVAGDVVVF